MPTATLSSKNQITLPADMVRMLGLKGGDKLLIIQSGDHLALFPKPANFTDYIVGSMKGFWGSKEEIDQYVAEERASWAGGDWLEQVEDLLAIDEGVRQVVEALSALPQHIATPNELGRVVSQASKAATDLEGKLTNKIDAALEQLAVLGAVRRISDPIAPKYRLVREVANLCKV